MSSVTDEWGMACPNCGEDDELDITATLDVRLTSNGTDADKSENGDTTWDEDSPCTCAACGHTGKVKDFEIEEEEAP